jgi:hypothetical protein
MGNFKKSSKILFSFSFSGFSKFSQRKVSFFSSTLWILVQSIVLSSDILQIQINPKPSNRTSSRSRQPVPLRTSPISGPLRFMWQARPSPKKPATLRTRNFEDPQLWGLVPFGGVKILDCLLYPKPSLPPAFSFETDTGEHLDERQRLKSGLLRSEANLCYEYDSRCLVPATMVQGLL